MLKKMNKKGFTLAELLIVVAIIAVLVLISFPIFTSSLNEAKEATDDANARAAKGVASVMLLTDAENIPDNDTMYYNIETGELQTAKPEAYGQLNKDQVIQVTFDEENNKVDVDWVE